MLPRCGCFCFTNLTIAAWVYYLQKKAQEEKLKAAERHKVLYAAQAKKAGSRGTLDDDNGEYDVRTEIKKSATMTDDGYLDNRAPSEMKLDDVKGELSPEEKKTEEVFCWLMVSHYLSG